MNSSSQEKSSLRKTAVNPALFPDTKSAAVSDDVKEEKVGTKRKRSEKEKDEETKPVDKSPEKKPEKKVFKPIVETIKEPLEFKLEIVDFNDLSKEQFEASR